MSLPDWKYGKEEAPDDVIVFSTTREEEVLNNLDLSVKELGGSFGNSYSVDGRMLVAQTYGLQWMETANLTPERLFPLEILFHHHYLFHHVL